MNIKLRGLTGDDIPQVIDMADALHKEGPFSGYEIDYIRTEFVLGELMVAPSAFTLGAFDKDELVGFVLGEIQLHPWLNMKMAVEHVFYVKPGYRSSKHGVFQDLVLTFESWAKKMGAHRLQMSTAARDEKLNEIASRSLSKLGVPRYGYIHAKDLT